MVLPAVDSYSMPTEDDLPHGRVDWTPDPTRSALLIHDMQDHFLKIFLAGQSPVRELVDGVGQLRAAALRQRIPVIYTAQRPDVPRPARGLLWDFWGPGLRSGSEGIVASLRPSPTDTVLTKHRYSAFHRTGLREVLQSAGRDQLVICGVYAHIGVNASACDAFSFDVEPFVVADAVADFSQAEHHAALRSAASQYAVVLPARRVLRSWESGARTCDGPAAAHARATPGH